MTSPEHVYINVENTLCRHHDWKVPPIQWSYLFRGPLLWRSALMRDNMRRLLQLLQCCDLTPTIATLLWCKCYHSNHFATTGMRWRNYDHCCHTQSINQSINQSNFYSANIPGEARLHASYSFMLYHTVIIVSLDDIIDIMLWYTLATGCQTSTLPSVMGVRPLPYPQSWALQAVI